MIVEVPAIKVAMLADFAVAPSLFAKEGLATFKVEATVIEARNRVTGSDAPISGPTKLNAHAEGLCVCHGCKGESRRQRCYRQDFCSNYLRRVHNYLRVRFDVL